MACIGEGGVTIGFEAGAYTGHKSAIYLTGNGAIQSIEHSCWTALCGVAENAYEQGDKHCGFQPFARYVTANDDATIEDIVKVSANLLGGQVGGGYFKVFGGGLAAGHEQVLHLSGCFQFLRHTLLGAAMATYDAGAKLDWHVHPGGQVLLITEGAGYHQERGKPAQIVHKGDVIKCAPGVEHWHGASRESSFAYIAVTPTQKGKTVWLEPVSDKDYYGVK